MRRHHEAGSYGQIGHSCPHMPGQRERYGYGARPISRSMWTIRAHPSVDRCREFDFGDGQPDGDFPLIAGDLA
jgi:hypothetical protein